MIRVYLVSQAVQAYVDPGTITLIIQVIVASSVAGLVMVVAFWRRVKAVFTKLIARFRRGSD